MRNFILSIVFACVAAHAVHGQVSTTGSFYYASGPGSFSGSTWEEYRNDTGETINLQIKVETNLGTSYLALEGDPGVPTANNIPPGAVFWLATYSYGPGGFGSYSEVRSIVGYTVIQTNHAPEISWAASPGSADSGQSYDVSAHGHDQDGNLTQVNVWKNGSPFAFAGGGNGTDGDSGNSSTDSGPQTITYTAQAVDAAGATSPVISLTFTINAPPRVNHAPTISWNSTPGNVAHADGYTVSAHGHDDDGNLTQVNLWKDGQPFAFAGGGDGTDGDSGNGSSDNGPQTITYTAQAVDSDGSTSATISQIVTIGAPPPVNHAPTITWTSSPGTVADGENYSVTAHGHDDDGNLTQVNLWRNGQPYAFAGGGNGSDGDSGNPSADSGPQTITFTAQAVDAEDATSVTISQIVTVKAPPPVNHAPTIAWTSSPGTVADGQNYSVNAHGHDEDGNLTQVNVWRNGQPYAFAGGGNGNDGDSGNASTDSGPQTITFTAQAVDADGATSGTISQLVIVNAPPPVNHAPTIAWTNAPGTVADGQSYTISAHGHDQDGNLSQVNIWRSAASYAFAGGGNGTDSDSGNASADAGPQTITFTAQAVDADGATSATISQTVIVTAPPPVNHAPTIAWTTNPGTVASGETYVISAHGHDDDGDLTQVNVWRDSQPYAFSGGGNGSDGDSGNPSTDTGPMSVTYSAQAVDSTGATSKVISQVVTISAPPPVNHPPTIAWTAAPGTVPSGEAYNISAHGHDDDGNLAQVNIRRDEIPFAFASGGNGYDGDSGNPANDSGPLAVTYTAQAVDASGATSAVISQTVTISAPPPVNRAPTIAWTATPGSVAHSQSYVIAAHGHDQDGNLSQIRIWKNGLVFTTAATTGTDGDGSDTSADVGPQIITFTAEAFDSAGAASGIITQAVVIGAPPPVLFTLTTATTTGGAVSAGGSFVSGTVVAVTATPDAIHDFTGWSGDASGSANPLSVTLDRDKIAQANFALKLFPLTTSATAGGSVTPGGSYAYGSVVTLTATPDPTARFTGWSGDASGSAPAIAVTMTDARHVVAVFTLKLAQSITFSAPSTQSTSSPAFSLGASASSGLPVLYTVVSGPATVLSDQLQINGPGAITIEASQPGDADYLPATPVARAFNAVAPAIIKYHAATRTLLQREGATGPTTLVIEKP